MFTVKWCVQHKQGEVIRMFQVDEVIVASPKTYLPNEPAPASPWKVTERFVEETIVILDPYHVNGGTSLANGMRHYRNII